VLCFLSVVLLSQWAIVDLNLPTDLSGLAFGLSNANLTLLDISTCVGLLSIFREIKAYICALGYKSSASLKTSHPCGFHL
jgi:hypothetical protein